MNQRKIAALCLTLAACGSSTPAGVVALTITPGLHDYGSVLPGGRSEPVTFTVANSGGVPSGPLSITITGSDASNFTRLTTTCTTGVDPAASCTMTVRFNPTGAGPKSAILSVHGTSGAPATSTLYGTAGSIEPQLRLSPTTQDFGQVVLGTTSSTVEFTVTNSGGTATGALDHAFSGADASQFAIGAGGCAGAPLAPGASCTITVRFLPTTAAAAVASLDVTTSQTAVRASAMLSAQGITPPLLTITPPSPASFAPTPVGGASASVTFTITNTGTAPTGSLTTALSGAHPSEFPIVADTNGCRGVVLDSGQTCTVVLAFVPTTVGTRAASLTVSANPGGSTTIALNGSAASAASLTLSPTGQDFGAVGIDTSSANVIFTVANNGGSPSGPIDVVLTGLDSLAFSIATNGCTAPLTPAGQVGSTCTLTLNFIPRLLGLKNASLSVSATSGGARSSPLAGRGIGAAAMSLSGTQAFGNVVGGETAANTYTVANFGAAPTAVITAALSGANAGEFSFLSPTGTDCVLGTTTLAGFPEAPATASSCTVRVRFTPTIAVGLNNPKAALLTVSATPGGSPSLALSANARALMSVSGNGNFSNVCIGCFSTNTFTLLNNATPGGPSTGVISLAAFGAPNANQFLFTGGTCVSGTTNLPPGNSCTIDVRFAPTTTGLKSSTLSAAGTAPTSNVSLALTGAGI